ncbi:hypothetical protein AV530_016063 [Patagioenas fasciata monilis]|uniref:Uncharacterized protein n=1 Tax=Patagioenas fasciata monilis TaxID=372326 RepID=A0A1V4KJW5_PATFA|nr:hypothetical protein AV530_016063 [Patagioenas fasciata monilis]
MLSFSCLACLHIMPQALKITDFSLYFHTQEEKNSDNKTRLMRDDAGQVAGMKIPESGKFSGLCSVWIC